LATYIGCAARTRTRQRHHYKRCFFQRYVIFEDVLFCWRSSIRLIDLSRVASRALYVCKRRNGYFRVFLLQPRASCTLTCRGYNKTHARVRRIVLWRTICRTSSVKYMRSFELSTHVLHTHTPIWYICTQINSSTHSTKGYEGEMSMCYTLSSEVL